MNKVLLQNILKIASFIAILVFSLFCISRVLVNGGNYLTYENYKNQDNVDVLFLGNSHMNSSILPTKIEEIVYEKTGNNINAYDASVAGIRMEQAYFFLKELIEIKKPKLVVMETYLFLPLLEEDIEIDTRFAFDDLPLSKNKIEAIDYIVPEKLLKDGQRATYLFPIIKHHGRWKEIESIDIERFTNLEILQKAGKEKTRVDRVLDDSGDGYFDKDVTKISEMRNITDTQEECLYKTITLLQEQNIPFEFISVPFRIQKDFDGIEMIKTNNYIDTILRAYDKKVFDMNRMWKDLCFSYKDLSDEGHTNFSGATKISNAVANHLLNYGLAPN